MQQEWQAASKTARASDTAGYLSTKTIAALCSPSGGAICILRISGSEAFSISEKLTASQREEWQERKAQRLWVVGRDQKRIDDAVMLPYFGPRSFTGEDSVEFFLHGSPMVAQKVLEETFSLGARMALPGEFSFRAVKNGKLTLSQAEAIKELVQAENDFALELSLEKLSGTQHKLVEGLKNELIQLVTLGEVGIDFSDQDIDVVSLPALKQRLAGVIKILLNLQGSFDRGKKISDGIPVSIFGLPNAGKSSFFNALLGEDRSIVSDIAGTTRDVVRERLNLKGARGYVSFKISDTAGLRKSVDQIEKIGIERSLKAAGESDFILIVLDGLKPELESVRKFLAQVEVDQKNIVWIASKSDLADAAQRSKLENELGLKPLWVSSVTTDGVHQAALVIAEAGERALDKKPNEVLLTRMEHFQAVELALQSLMTARDSEDLVLFASCLRHALNDLGPLIGETLPDDVLGKIFSDFCIGK